VWDGRRRGDACIRSTGGPVICRKCGIRTRTKIKGRGSEAREEDKWGGRGACDMVNVKVGAEQCARRFTMGLWEGFAKSGIGSTHFVR
jgi:hypothetical protein